MKPNTILILSHCFAPNTGGVETHLSDLTAYLRKNDMSAHVITYQPLVSKARGEYFESSGSVSIRRLPWIGFGLFNILEKYPALQFAYLFPPLFLAAFATLLLHRNKIAAMHCHGMVCAVAGRILKIFFGNRVIVSTHAIYGWLYDLEKPSGMLPSFLRWTLSGADRVLALAEYSRKEVIRLGVPENITGTYTYWVDQKTFSPGNRSEYRRSLNIDNRFTLMFVGRLIPVKGVLELLSAAELLPDILFIVAGDGPLQTEVEKIAQSCTNISYRGRINNKDLAAYYNAADALCVPSKYEEGFGRIILEALSCGCPVIASRKGGIPEAMDETVGIFIEPAPENIALAVRKLMDNPQKTSELRTRCRQYAETKFSERNASVIIESYRI